MAVAEVQTPAPCMRSTQKLCSLTRQPLSSTVHRGVAFEERSLLILQKHLSMALSRVGGKSDGGIDLQGWWWLPQCSRLSSTALPKGNEVSWNRNRRRLRVLAQCKAEKRKMGPNYVREMEGVLYRYVSAASAIDDSEASISTPTGPALSCIALLISQSAFTTSTLLRAQSSPIPFFLLHLPVLDGADEGKEESDVIGAAFWNPALAGEQGLLGGEIDIRWERSPVEGGRPGLWYLGQKLESWVPKFEASLEDPRYGNKARSVAALVE